MSDTPLFATAFWSALLAGALRAGTPLVYVGLGELIYERSGVLNLGLEGFMLIGAVSSVWAEATWGSWPLSVAVGALCAAGACFLHGLLCVLLGTNQVATGLAFVILGQGVTAFLGRDLVGQRIAADLDVRIPYLADIPLLGPALFHQDILVYASILCTLGVWLFLFRTRSGIALRAVGENAEAAASHGIRVTWVRLAASAVCGAFCGLGGAHLALAYASQWQENMTAGRGWIALVLVIFAMWRPGRLLLAGYLFGGLSSLHLNLQAWGISSSSYLLATLPFVLSLVVLVFATISMGRRPLGMPSDLGRVYLLKN
jgi:general nucleoside transport system permease protein